MEYVRSFTRELATGNTVQLAVENRAGIVAVRGEETDRVRIEVVAHLWAETEDEADDQTELLARGIRQEGKRVVVRAPALLRAHPFLFFSRTPRVEYAIIVPAGCEANISNRSGRVEVERIRGPLDVTARSGRVLAREIENDVRISSASGGVQAEALGAALTIESRSGAVRVGGCRGNATIHSRSGSLQIEEVGGNLDLQTRSGSVSISEAGGALRLSATSGSVRYDGPVRGPIDIEVMSGSLRVTVDADSVFFLDAESIAGSVRSDLPLRSKSSAPPKDAPTVRLRTRAGSIYIGQR